MAKEEKLRSEIEDKYKWDLTRMYKSDDDFYSDLKKADELLNKIINYKGKITKNAENLYNYMVVDDELNTLSTNLYVYASSLRDTDVTNVESTKKYNEIMNFYSKYGEESSFVMPELLSLDYEKIKDYIKFYEPLKEYSFDLEEIYKYQKYTLSEKEEILLSNISDLRYKFRDNFNVANNSLVDFGYIKDEEDDDVKLTNGNYSKYMQSSDRRVRRDAFIAKGKAYKKYASLLATDYEAAIKADSMVAKARGYKSSLEMYLYPDGLTEDMYKNLLKVSDNNLPVLHKYFKLIKDVLKLDKLEAYDLSAPLFKKSNKIYKPSDAIDLICEALSVYGDEYVKELRKGYEEKWIDFYPNKNKKVGYYQNDSSKGIVVFGNYNEDYSSVSSIAHELGHAMHSFYSRKYNKPHNAEYSILVAEIASLTNEMLLSNYVINNTNDKELKLEALHNILDVFAGNFFGTLSQGSVFEDVCHKRVFNGESLSVEDFNNIYYNIVLKHNGSLVNENEYLKYNWARIPHFYNSFYYYKYSIGVCGACYVAKKILSGDKEFLEKYLNFLKLGSTMNPLDEMKTIGFDLNSKEIIEAGINYFSELIDEFMVIYNS